MIDSLKELVELIDKLPTLALWICVGFALYKLSIIASIYGVIRLGITRLFDYLQTRSELKIDVVKINDFIITGQEEALVKQLKRLRWQSASNVSGSKVNGTYIHESGVIVLEKALDMYFEECKKNRNFDVQQVTG